MPKTIQYILQEFKRAVVYFLNAPATESFADFQLSPCETISPPRHPDVLKQTYDVYFAKETEQTICARFAKIAKQYAAKPAVIGANNVITYRELDYLSNALGAKIVELCGVENLPVALLFDHDAPMVTCILGILKANKAYVPLDPAQPAERMRYILENSGAGIIVTNRHYLAIAQSLAIDTTTIIILDDIDPRQSFPLPQGSTQDSLAYILYTSGTTGRPKGIAQSHDNVLHFIRRYVNQLHIGANDRLALFASYSSEAGVKGIFASLLNGGTVCPFNLRDLANWERLPEWVNKKRITLWHSIPAVYRNFLKRLNSQQEFPSVRLVVLGGDVLLYSDVDAHRHSPLSHAVMVNLHGMTEASLNLMWEIDLNDVAPIRLGYPFADNEVKIINEEGNYAQVYEPGEIFLESTYIAQGYWKDAERSEKAFSTLPDGKVQYRTGDIGRRLPDNSIQFLGRRDFQVKIRGFRVELAEIEQTLCLHTAIKDAIVVAHDNQTDKKVLCAYLVSVDRDSTLSSQALRSYLASLHPDYMVPTHFVYLEKMPLTPTGKIDRKALPKFAPEASAALEVVLPLTENSIEITIAKIWRELLKCEKILPEDQFLNLGGSSLMILEMIDRVNRQCAVEVPLAEFLRSPTFGLMLSLVEKQISNVQ